MLHITLANLFVLPPIVTNDRFWLIDKLEEKTNGTVFFQSYEKILT
jgi:hypothetical protein